MDFTEFHQTLRDHGPLQIVFRFAAGEKLPAHFHVTEIGKVTKDFIDCGGTRRTAVACVLQTLVADDVEHRLTAMKLSGILDHATTLNITSDSPVEVEIQTETVSVFSLDDFEVTDQQLIFDLKTKQTACLAPDRCGLEILGDDDSCCGDTGCC